MITSSDVILALLSGCFGAFGAQALSIWHTGRLEKERREYQSQLENERLALTSRLEAERQAFEVQRAKIDALRKIAGKRAAITDKPILEHRPRFFEGLNEVMIVFSDSAEVSNALVQFKAAVNTQNQNDRLIDLFKAICRNVGIDASAFNDSLFLGPFSPSVHH